jgi:hypothetical protein
MLRKKTITRRRRLARLAKYQDNLCFHCGMPLELLEVEKIYGSNEGNGKWMASYDHLIPRDQNGPDRMKNTVIAHRSCNSIKGNNLPDTDMLKRLKELNKKRTETLITSVTEDIHIFLVQFMDACEPLIKLSNAVNELPKADTSNKLRISINEVILSYSRKIEELIEIKDRNIKLGKFRTVFNQYVVIIAERIPTEYRRMVRRIMIEAWKQKEEKQCLLDNCIED